MLGLFQCDCSYVGCGESYSDHSTTHAQVTLKLKYILTALHHLSVSSFSICSVYLFIYMISFFSPGKEAQSDSESDHVQGVVLCLWERGVSGTETCKPSGIDTMLQTSWAGILIPPVFVWTWRSCAKYLFYIINLHEITLFNVSFVPRIPLPSVTL